MGGTKIYHSIEVFEARGVDAEWVELLFILV
jgi:hypothetical protein